MTSLRWGLRGYGGKLTMWPTRVTDGAAGSQERDYRVGLRTKCSMKRVCFDIACNAFHNFRDGWLGDPITARQYFEQKDIRFYAATACVCEAEDFIDFTDFGDLLGCLAGADEIVSFNGRVYDLIMLEKLVGRDAASAVWEKPHHDLAGWRGCHSLKEAVSRFLPQLAASFESAWVARRSDLLHASHSDFQRDQLAGAYRDSKFTRALFRQYVMSGDNDFTFRDA